jgi:hypothetical protein
MHSFLEAHPEAGQAAAETETGTRKAETGTRRTAARNNLGNIVIR